MNTRFINEFGDFVEILKERDQCVIVIRVEKKVAGKAIYRHPYMHLGPDWHGETIFNNRSPATNRCDAAASGNWQPL